MKCITEITNDHLLELLQFISDKYGGATIEDDVLSGLTGKDNQSIEIKGVYVKTADFMYSKFFVPYAKTGNLSFVYHLRNNGFHDHSGDMAFIERLVNKINQLGYTLQYINSKEL